MRQVLWRRSLHDGKKTKQHASSRRCDQEDLRRFGRVVCSNEDYHGECSCRKHASRWGCQRRQRAEKETTREWCVSSLLDLGKRNHSSDCYQRALFKSLVDRRFDGASNYVAETVESEFAGCFPNEEIFVLAASVKQMLSNC